MALRQGLKSIHASLLNYFRAYPQQLTVPCSLVFLRRLAEGTFLDRQNVTERVLHVVRHFEKIDPDKVDPHGSHLFHLDCGLGHAGRLFSKGLGVG